MDKIIVKGGAALKGRIPISGAKNACLTLMPAALLTDEPLTLTNAPRLADILTMKELLSSLGCEIASLQDGRVLALGTQTITSHLAHYDIVRKMRASILVLGPMLARMGEATVSMPGPRSEERTWSSTLRRATWARLTAMTASPTPV